MLEFFSHFIQPDAQTALLIVVNLILIESLLSVDNAAVLATMVMDLPSTQRKRALRVGIIFAYLFRGTALVFASILIRINWLKFCGGLYLLYLCVHFFYKRIRSVKTEAAPAHGQPTAIRHAKKLPGLNMFWSTVTMVEMMDLAFSLDNVFAAVAFTKNIYLICVGVFIGIITMRIVAGYFVDLMERFPFLELTAFVVIGILGFRLCMDFACTYLPDNPFCKLLESTSSDFYFSVLTVAVFVLPLLTSALFNFPKRRD